MSKYDETREVLWRKIQQLGEIQIRCDQAAPLAPISRGNRFVLRTLKIFIKDSRNIVAGCYERRLPTRIAILVKFEPHCQVVTSIGRTRSRVISAAYARQARTSSGLRLG